MFQSFITYAPVQPGQSRREVGPKGLYLQGVVDRLLHTWLKDSSPCVIHIQDQHSKIHAVLFHGSTSEQAVVTYMDGRTIVYEVSDDDNKIHVNTLKDFTESKS
jgi:hypothetical protein